MCVCVRGQVGVDAHHDVSFALVQAVVSQLLVGAATVEDAGAGQVHEVVHCDDKESL